MNILYQISIYTYTLILILIHIIIDIHFFFLGLLPLIEFLTSLARKCMSNEILDFRRSGMPAISSGIALTKP